jgi:hypothetical protein
MAPRLGFVVATALALAALDLGLDAVLPTEAWGFHQRSPAWAALAASLLVVVALLGALPSRLVALASGLVAGGILGNLASGRLHGGRVPNPIVLGTVALNLADLLVLAGVPLLVFALARVSIRHREWIDRNIPPRRWELVLRRRIGL